MKKQSQLASFRNAFAGIRRTAARERNFRVQIIIAILAVIACIVFRVDTFHFILVVVAIFFVLAMELMNTAVEALVDMYCKNTPHPLAKKAKDTAAGAVLIASFMALITGVVVAVSVIGRYI